MPSVPLFCGSTASATIKVTSPALTIPPAGDRLTLGGIDWIVLDENDGNGNALIVTASTHGNSQFRTAANQGNAYAGSRLETSMKAFYDQLKPEVKDRVQPVVLPNESVSFGTQTWNPWSISGGLSSVGGSNETAFALSYGEVQKYMGWTPSRTAYTSINSSFQVAPPDRWWLRSVGGSSASAGVVHSNGQVYGSTGVTSTIGIRPALWISLNQ